MTTHSWTNELETARKDPRRWEDLYRSAQRAGEAEAFAAEVHRQHAAAPDDVLAAVWHYRLEENGAGVEAALPLPVAAERTAGVNWRVAIPLALLLSVLYWVMAGALLQEQRGIPLWVPSTGVGAPFLLVTWAPIAVIGVLLFLRLAPEGTGSVWSRLAKMPRTLWILAGLVAASAYVCWFVYSNWPHRNWQNDYSVLAALHLPLLGGIAALWAVVAWSADNRSRFAFLLKTTEVIVIGGLFFGVVVIFAGITIGLFSALGVEFSMPLLRVLVVALPGLIPVLAVAITYNPNVGPGEQRFDQGFVRLILTAGRLFLVPALVVGVIYLLSIPANFWRPFQDRDVLIIYNAMLFAVIALLVFSTPLDRGELAPRWERYLRGAMIAVAVLAILVSVYALAATVYRTNLGGLTVNRLTILGWNSINIVLLVAFVWRQARAGAETWIPAAHGVYRLGMIAYSVWTVVLLLVVPLAFR